MNTRMLSSVMGFVAAIAGPSSSHNNHSTTYPISYTSAGPVLDISRPRGWHAKEYGVEMGMGYRKYRTRKSGRRSSRALAHGRI